MNSHHHAALMDRTYRYQRRIYDVTRAWFLLGRDHLIANLSVPEGGSVLEIACGTGRNLDHIGRRFPNALLYGLDISTEMLRSARAKLGGRAGLGQGDACDFNALTLLGRAEFDRIILSYSLSMIPDWPRALDNALVHLAEGGSLHLVDFGRQHRLPGLARAGLNAWLARFHVTPRQELSARLRAIAAHHGLSCDIVDLYGSYALHAILSKPQTTAF